MGTRRRSAGPTAVTLPVAKFATVATLLSVVLGFSLATLVVPLDALSTTRASCPAPKTRNLPHLELEFDPDGVCISPRYFIAIEPEVGAEASFDGTVETTANNHNSDSDNKAAAATAATSAAPGRHRRCFTMRNVPGDGDCMFLAVALAAATSAGLGVGALFPPDDDSELLRATARETRRVVAEVLSAPNGTLYVDRNTVVDAPRLLRSAVAQEPGVDTASGYLAALRREGRDGGLHGGGPELVALSNVLRRPISIYEIDDNYYYDDDARWNNNNERRHHRRNEKRRRRWEEEEEGTEPSGGDRTDNATAPPGDVLPIVCKGSFGDGIFEDPCLTAMPDSVLGSNLRPGAYSWRLHILVLNSSPTEKHACVLFPQQIYR